MDDYGIVLGTGRDYRNYEMSEKEMVIGWAGGFFGALIVFFAFHVKLIIAIPVCIFCGFYGIRLFSDYLMRKDKKSLLIQFVSLIDALRNSYQSGCNSLEAFEFSRDDLVTQYGKTSLVVIEIERILEAFENNIPLEVALEDFAERSGLEDVENFASAFKICGDMEGIFQTYYAKSMKL